MPLHLLLFIVNQHYILYYYVKHKILEMAPQCINSISSRLALVLLIVILFVPNPTLSKKKIVHGLNINVIDRCWRRNQDWRRNRQQLATCSVGFAGKMSNNIGRDLKNYEVTDPSDNAVDPKPGTLRYGTTMIQGKVWITFQRDMTIRLQKPLLISSFTAIDGRGATVNIADNACLMIFKVTSIYICFENSIRLVYLYNKFVKGFIHETWLVYVKHCLCKLTMSSGKQHNHPWTSNPPLQSSSTKLSYGSESEDSAAGSGGWGCNSVGDCIKGMD